MRMIQKMYKVLHNLGKQSRHPYCYEFGWYHKNRTMFLIDCGFSALTVLRVSGETAFKGDGVVVLIGLAG